MAEMRTGFPEINSVADPAPLGLGGFAATTFALSLINAGVISGGTLPMVLSLMLFYGGILQMLAGMWEFRNNRNTFGAVAFTSYGAFWLSLWYLFTYAVPKIPAADLAAAVGTFLLVWTVFTFYMWVGSFRLNGALLALFTALLATFIFLTIGAYSGGSTWTKIGGWLGIITAIIAWYTAAAVVVNFTFGRAVLPVYPLARARA